MSKFDFSDEALRKHSLDMRQFIDARESTLPNGMRIIDVYNASGLHFTILPDRGMDIWTVHYKGIPLTWISLGSPHPPDYGSSWLRQFNGGLLTTCGLTHVGPAEVDTITGEQRDLHGNFTRLRAGSVQVTNDGAANDYTLRISSKITESRLFGEQLSVERTFTIQLGKPEFSILDNITNTADVATPCMFLYHFNLGYPIISDGAKLYLPSHAVYPRDAEAQAGFENWQNYAPPTPQYAEQVFFHHLKTETNWTHILIGTPELGLELAWHTDTMPYFTQWKNTRSGIYVCGVEPGNCLPEGQEAARKNGRLTYIQPGETISFGAVVRIKDGNEAVQKTIGAINALASKGYPVEGFKLT